ncbi:MAG: sulfatase-like hydrolase/transferase, partial [Fidelibacterota bacterium]
SSRQAYWRGRAEGQPFFAVINFTITHESQIRTNNAERLAQLAGLGPDEKHDPARAELPPYYPDTPVVRQDWARYYDLITLMDKRVADVLQQLEDDGLAENTIVWFWGDHGRGLPRAKRWIYDSGLHVPLIIRVPEQLLKLASPSDLTMMMPGTINDDLVSFIDFAPTMLSLAGVKVPEYMQGQPFLGGQKAEPREYIFAARDRMDEACDLIRAVRDKRFKYIRNFMPHVTYGQDIDYMNQMPTMREMRRLNAEGRLQGSEQNYFMPSKPVEELYDTASDPHEIHNLAGDPRYQDELQRLRLVLLEWMKTVGDVGLIPEADFDELKRPGGKYETTAEPGFSPVKKFFSSTATVSLSCPTDGASIAYQVDLKDEKTGWQLYSEPITLKSGQVLSAKACRLGFSDSEVVQYRYGDPATPAQPPVPTRPHWRDQLDATDLQEHLLAIKALDGQNPTRVIPAYFEALEDKDAPVRYWAVVGLHNTCKDAGTINKARIALHGLMIGDTSQSVRVAAAHALCDWGWEDQALPVLVDALEQGADNVRLAAATALGRIGEKARPALPQLKAAMKDRYEYVPRVCKYTLQRLGVE